MEDSGYRMKKKIRKNLHRISSLVLTCIMLAAGIPVNAFELVSVEDYKEEDIEADSILPLSGVSVPTELMFTEKEGTAPSLLSDGSIRFPIEHESFSDISSGTKKDPGEAYVLPLTPDSVTLWKNSSKTSKYDDIDFSISKNELCIGIPLSISGNIMQKAYVSFNKADAVCSFENTEEDGSIDFSKKTVLTVRGNNGNTTSFDIRAKYISDIPVMEINLTDSSKTIDRYKTVSADLIFEGNTYPMDIRGRGNTSWWNFPQKGYLLKLKDEASFMEMHDSDRWVLIPCYLDRSLIRNPLSMDMARVMDDLEFTPGQYPVNIFLNGRYEGIYVLSEQIEEAADKVDLFPGMPKLPADSSVSDNEEDMKETPFFLECGGDLRKYHVYGQDYVEAAHTPKMFFHYPEPEKPNTPEYKYVKKYIDDTDKAIVNGEDYEKYIDTDSFADWFIIMEMSCNTDSAFWRSTFLYKPEGEKLKLGPVWDFDRAYGNFTYDNNSYAYWASAEQVYDRAQNHWMSYLYKSDDFMLKVRERWDEKKEELLSTAMSSIDRYSKMTESSREYHNRRFGSYSTPSSVESVRKFVLKRYNWIDESIHMDDFNRHPAPYTVSDTPPEDGMMLDPFDIGVLPEQTVPVAPDTGAATVTDTDPVTGAAAAPSAPQSIISFKPYTSGLMLRTSQDTVSGNDTVYTVSGSASVKISDFDRKPVDIPDDSIYMNFVSGRLICSGGKDNADIRESVSVNKSTVCINKKGCYILSGNLRNGNIKINVPEDKKVRLILNGIRITSDTDAPVDIESADKVSVTIAEGTMNVLTKNGSYRDDSKANACLYSDCDLSINGNGYIRINSETGNGIGSKDDIKISGGHIEIKAAKNGIKGNDSVSIFDGELCIKAGKDGVKSSKDAEKKGFIFINGGKTAIASYDDGFDCAREFVFKNGLVKVSCTGKKISTSGYTEGAENF